MIGEYSWIAYLYCQCRCQIFKSELYLSTVFYYNFLKVSVALVCLKAETSLTNCLNAIILVNYLLLAGKLLVNCFLAAC